MRWIRALVWMTAAVLMTGCADVQQVFVLHANEAIAWRWQASPTTPLVVPEAVTRWADDLVPDEWTDAAAWTENRQGRTWFIVQVRVVDVATWGAAREALVARVTAVVGEVPALLLPPLLTPDAEAWTLSVVQEPTEVAQAPGRWALEVTSAGGADPEAVTLREGAMQWSGDTSQLLAEGVSVRATVATDEPSSLRSIARGGLSMGLALAGLLVLGWVIRRTRKRIDRAAYA